MSNGANMMLNKYVTNHRTELFADYSMPKHNYDEYFSSPRHPRHLIHELMPMLNNLSISELCLLDKKAKQIFKDHGITFKVYGNEKMTDHIFPFDLLPRIISSKEWQKIERGLQQRIHALNIFLRDIYGSQKIIKDKIIPSTIIESCPDYIWSLQGRRLSGEIPVNVAGFDLIRNTDGELYILEDNLRIPSGVSYVLENRKTMRELLPDWMEEFDIHEVSEYPQQLKIMLNSLARYHQDNPLVVVLTPGPYNSAYFEHAYLAEKTNCPLVECSDLFVENNRVYWRCDKGTRQVDVIYKRTDDSFIDPKFFRSDSLLGIPGIVEAHLAGNVVFANALGNGVADDKAVYHYLPEIIRYYLGEEPMIPQITTYLAANEGDRRYILSHLDKLVIKEVNQSGGYGMLIGPNASQQDLREFRNKIMASPRSYIAQPLIELSTTPTLTKRQLRPCRVDLRAFVLSGHGHTWVLPGALTRVTLNEDSYIVNSSQGGGSKDTWVMED